MPSPITMPTLRDVRRALTSLLLVGAMLAPAVESIAHWPIHTPFDVSMPMHLTLLVAVALVTFGLTDRGVLAETPWSVWLLAPPIAVGIATIVRWRANVFYTADTIVDGMALLFAVHAGTGLLRRQAMRRAELALVEHEPSHRWRRAADLRRHIRARCLPATPALRLADALDATVGWIVLVAWILIAFEHRHPAGPLLLVAGALATLALLALVPDALATFGPLARRRMARHDRMARARGPALVRDDDAGTSLDRPLARRQS